MIKTIAHLEEAENICNKTRDTEIIVKLQGSQALKLTAKKENRAKALCRLYYRKRAIINC